MLDAKFVTHRQNTEQLQYYIGYCKYTVQYGECNTILSSKTTVLLRSIPFRNCCTILALPISSEIIDGF